ncbi:hypothetical protein ACFL21_02090 [Patescibacteria group bacterium]
MSNIEEQKAPQSCENSSAYEKHVQACQPGYIASLEAIIDPYGYEKNPRHASEAFINFSVQKSYATLVEMLETELPDHQNKRMRILKELSRQEDSQSITFDNFAVKISDSLKHIASDEILQKIIHIVLEALSVYHMGYAISHANIQDIDLDFDEESTSLVKKIDTSEAPEVIAAIAEKEGKEAEAEEIKSEVVAAIGAFLEDATKQNETAVQAYEDEKDVVEKAMAKVIEDRTAENEAKVKEHETAKTTAENALQALYDKDKNVADAEFEEFSGYKTEVLAAIDEYRKIMEVEEQELNEEFVAKKTKILELLAKDESKEAELFTQAVNGKTQSIKIEWTDYNIWNDAEMNKAIEKFQKLREASPELVDAFKEFIIIRRRKSDVSRKFSDAKQAFNQLTEAARRKKSGVTQQYGENLPVVYSRDLQKAFDSILKRNKELFNKTPRKQAEFYDEDAPEQEELSERDQVIEDLHEGFKSLIASLAKREEKNSKLASTREVHSKLMPVITGEKDEMLTYYNEKLNTLDPKEFRKALDYIFNNKKDVFEDDESSELGTDAKKSIEALFTAFEDKLNAEHLERCAKNICNRLITTFGQVSEPFKMDQWIGEIDLQNPDSFKKLFNYLKNNFPTLFGDEENPTEAREALQALQQATKVKNDHLENLQQAKRASARLVPGLEEEVDSIRMPGGYVREMDGASDLKFAVSSYCDDLNGSINTEAKQSVRQALDKLFNALEVVCEAETNIRLSETNATRDEYLKMFKEHLSKNPELAAALSLHMTLSRNYVGRSGAHAGKFYFGIEFDIEQLGFFDAEERFFMPDVAEDYDTTMDRMMELRGAFEEQCEAEDVQVEIPPLFAREVNEKLRGKERELEGALGQVREMQEALEGIRGQLSAADVELERKTSDQQNLETQAGQVVGQLEQIRFEAGNLSQAKKSLEERIAELRRSIEDLQSSKQQLEQDLEGEHVSHGHTRRRLSSEKDAHNALQDNITAALAGYGSALEEASEITGWGSGKKANLAREDAVQELISTLQGLVPR